MRVDMTPKEYQAVSYTHLDVYKRQQQGDVCLEAGGPQPVGGSHLLPELLALVFIDVRKDDKPLGMGRLDAARQIQGVLVELGKDIQLRACLLYTSSNSLPRPWQGRALPDELRPQTQD